ncbi:ABC-2 type transport system permease protein [Serratia fonticola]|uniref:ABC-2 type transport system permease protein n=1 Tax=Serratia fonticola TaxID=47917 RepID=A0A542BPY6_SERFO|nr:ABC transporter permease [Serratia fonticola]TQI80567.1 ABC-2 type transport system permease protein [Serratia fonticola]TQI97408.1 ABC-2 type transport system permease protein [Serratia fonticola]TVZ71904.1 ABC-2 type transport system permease protein [Serratia fonticola]
MLFRVTTLIIKELRSLLRDPQTRIILIAPVIFQVLLFPFAATLEVTNATVAVYSEDSGPASVELTQRFARTKAFSHLLLLKNPQDVSSVIENQQALVLVRFPANFSRHLLSGEQASLQVLLDGRNSNSAQIAANYIQQITREFEQEFIGQLPHQNNSQLILRNWYNPNLDYKWFVIPCLIAMIATIGVLTVTSLSITREREQGTLEQLLVSPLNTWQIFIGKAIPALIIALLQTTLVLLIGIFGYQIPFVGSFGLLYFSLVIYGVSLVGVGLLISAFCMTQQQAFIGVFMFMMPAILLSGYVSPVENMPVWLQKLTWINPIRHFTDIAKMLYLKDASFSIIWPNLWPQLIVTVITSGVAYVMFKKKIA